MIVKDAMVLIHLAKTTLLERSCIMFKNVIVPELVYKEAVIEGKKRGHEDSFLVDSVINTGKIEIIKVKDRRLLEKLGELNVYGGEAEAIALYWEQKSDLIASDDSNIVKKRDILGIRLIGTPSIVISLHRNKLIDEEKVRSTVKKLKEIGWFSSTILDKIIMEVEKREL